MNNHSIIKLISLFFLAVFIVVNSLFYTANLHFSKQEEIDEVRRFMLADKLFHYPKADFSKELEELMIKPSTVDRQTLLGDGQLVFELPFGKIMRMDGIDYFVNTPPPPHDYFLNKNISFFPPPPPPPPHKHILQNTKPSSMLLLWIVLLFIDILMLLFFFYLLRKLLPLYHLKNAIISFAKQDKPFELTLNGKDEISQITQEFNSALKKIASLKEARSLFMRNILHELKTPIMKASLITECLEPSPHQEHLKQVFLRMDYLLNQFAKMERFSSGEWQLNLGKYRFVDLLDHACDITDNFAKLTYLSSNPSIRLHFGKQLIRNIIFNPKILNIPRY
jgi:two-component system OmpR family sensor kinase